MITDDLDGKPFQLKFVRQSQMLMFANAVCDPPLGQATVIPDDQHAVQFTVLIESSKSFPQQEWEAVIWHNSHEHGEWHGLILQEAVDASKPLSITSINRGDVYRRYFTAGLTKMARSYAPVKFTLKFRLSSSDNWRWANEQSCLDDGELYYQSRSPPPDLEHYLDGFSPDLVNHAVRSEVPNTQLWSILGPVEKAHGSESGYTDYSLGIPRSFTRWFSLTRIWTPWLAPRHGKKKFAPPEDAILSSFLRWDGFHLVLLAVSGVDDVLTVFKSDDQGNVIIHAMNDNEDEGLARVIVAVGRTFESANAAVMYHARKLVRGDRYMSGEAEAEMQATLDGGVNAKWMENWYDGLTYCTWNGLGQELNEQKIYNALDILKANDVLVTNLIIDDNWQSLDRHGDSQFKRGWTDFDANKEGFPQGLKYTATKIRGDHPNIQHIAVWHAILGYWGGVSPDGNIAKKYKTRQVRKKNGLVGGVMTVVDADDAQRLYDDFYRFLSNAGIDSVKTDAQFFLDLLDDAEDRRRFIKTYQDAWTISSLRYFSIKAISCMSQAPQILFHSQLPTNKPRLMVRNSDDFFPEVPTSHPWHIFTNAHNSLLTSHLNILPDWDMFQTSHPYSAFHAAGRCVSGGPIYFTDEPGKHDINLIRQMTAQTINGKTIILRPSIIGKSIGIYTAYEEERLLKVGTYTGRKGIGTGILGIFNVRERPLSELVNLVDFPGVEAGYEYVIRGHTTGEVSAVMKLEDLNAKVSLEVDVKGYEILSAYPLRTFTLKGSQGMRHDVTKVAVLGLLGKMTGAAAIVSTDMRVADNGKLKVAVILKALGILGVFISNLDQLSIEDNFLITILGQVIPMHTIKVARNSSLLEIDVGNAWKEMGLDGGWSNETKIEMYIG